SRPSAPSTWKPCSPRIRRTTATCSPTSWSGARSSISRTACTAHCARPCSSGWSCTPGSSISTVECAEVSVSDEPPNRDDQTDPSTGDVEEGYADERDEPRGDWRAVLHRARVPITLAVLLVLMAGAAWYGWQALLSDPEPTTSSTSRECVTP